MPFDISAGLSSAGAAVAATAGAATLEAQKADLEMQKVRLADELAGKREETQRGFLTSERVATQGFTSGENVLNRASAKDLAQIQADAMIKGHSISAGATVAAAQLGAAAHKYSADVGANTAAALNDVHLRLGQKVIPGENGTLAVLKPGETKPTPVLNADGTPFKSVDPELLRGQAAILNGAYKERQDLGQVFKTRLVPLETEINVLLKSAMPGQRIDPDAQRKIDTLKTEQQKVIDEYKRDATEIQAKIDSHIDAFMGRKGATPGVAAPAPGGLINRNPSATPVRPSLDQLYDSP